MKRAEPTGHNEESSALQKLIQHCINRVVSVIAVMVNSLPPILGLKVSSCVPDRTSYGAFKRGQRGRNESYNSTRVAFSFPTFPSETMCDTSGTLSKAFYGPSDQSWTTDRRHYQIHAVWMLPNVKISCCALRDSESKTILHRSAGSMWKKKKK